MQLMCRIICYSHAFTNTHHTREQHREHSPSCEHSLREHSLVVHSHKPYETNEQTIVETNDCRNERTIVESCALAQVMHSEQTIVETNEQTSEPKQ